MNPKDWYPFYSQVAACSLLGDTQILYIPKELWCSTAFLHLRSCHMHSYQSIKMRSPPTTTLWACIRDIHGVNIWLSGKRSFFFLTSDTFWRCRLLHRKNTDRTQKGPRKTIVEPELLNLSCTRWIVLIQLKEAIKRAVKYASWWAGIPFELYELLGFQL